MISEQYIYAAIKRGEFRIIKSKKRERQLRKRGETIIKIRGGITLWDYWKMPF